jgi:hypothetical protein
MYSAGKAARENRLSHTRKAILVLEQVMGFEGIAWASSHALGVTLLEGEACSSRLKAAPRAERSLSGAISALCPLRLGVRNFQIWRERLVWLSGKKTNM